MKYLIYIIIAASLLLLSCDNKPSLQKYFVENQDNPNFISFDLSSSLLNVDKAKLTDKQKKALESFSKINVLAFKVNKQNRAEYESQKSELDQVFKDKKYQELIKVGSGKDVASISFTGNEDHIDEFILYGNKTENGFAVLRVLGKDMNPNNLLTMLSVLKESKRALKGYTARLVSHH